MNQAAATLVQLAAQSLGIAALQSSLVAAALLALERVRPRWGSGFRGGLVMLALAKLAMPPWIAWPWPGVTGLPAGGAPPPLPPWLAPALLAVWTLGSLVALAALVRGWLRLERALAAAVPCHDRRAIAALEVAARQVGLRAVPGLFVCASAAAPYAAGLRDPRILLPAGWAARLGDADLEAVLLHEAAHVARRDLVRLHFAAALGVLWWWNPVFHWAHARWRAVIEEGCDDHAIAARGRSPAAYCRALLQAARLVADAPRPLGAPAGAAGMSVSALERRLRRLLGAGFAPRRRIPAVQLIALLLIGLALLPSLGRPALDGPRARHLAAHALDHRGRHGPSHAHVIPVLP